jgi:hypothetical protein
MEAVAGKAAGAVFAWVAVMADSLASCDPPRRPAHGAAGEATSAARLPRRSSILVRSAAYKRIPKLSYGWYRRSIEATWNR